LGVIAGSVSDYIAAHPINTFVDNTAFRTAITQYVTDLRGIITSYISRAQYSDSVRVGNAELDFNTAINDANTTFYDTLNSVIITDPDYQSKYNAVRTNIDNYTTAIISRLQSEITNVYQSALFDFINSTRTACYAQISAYVFNRPILRVVDFRYPVEIGLSNDYMPAKNVEATATSGAYVLDAVPAITIYNTVEIDLKNVGRKNWTGWVGLIVTDEYYKKLEFLTQTGTNYVIKPGEIVTVKRDIILPRTMMVDGQARSLGKVLTYKIVINTIT